MNKKFTLIELIVIVAVIGILVSLLLPALSRSRHIAKFAVCKSNISQISKGLYLYSNSNSRRLPTSGNNRTTPKYHRYAWQKNFIPGVLGKLVDGKMVSEKILFCPQANESAENSNFKESTYLTEGGVFQLSQNSVVRSPYIYLPYESKLKGVFVDSLEEKHFLIGSTFLSKKEIFHFEYGAMWNVGLVSGAVPTRRSKKAFSYLQSTYSGGEWSKANTVRQFINQH